MKLNRAEATSVWISKPKANRNISSVLNHCRILNPELQAGFSSAPSHHSASGGWSSSCASGWKLNFQEDTWLRCSQAFCVPSGVMLATQCRLSRHALREDLYTADLLCSPCMTCGHRASENKDLWPSMRVHRTEQHVLKLKSDPNKGGQTKRQHNSHWSAFTCWIVLKDSSSF